MIHVVTIHNQHLYARQLDDMFRMRHEFYVKQRGWDDLVSENGRETDEFDNEHAVYLMNLDRYGQILATFRLNPTNTPYLLGDKQPEYLEGDVPRSEEIWDLTRWMVVPHARRKSAGHIADAQKVLLCGVMEFAVSRGATALTCLMDTVFYERMAKVWPVSPLGPARRFEVGNGEAMAVLIEAGPHVLADTRKKTGIYGSVVFEIEGLAALAEDELQKRHDAVEEEKQMTPAELNRVREAADHLVRELQGLTPTNVDASIQAIDTFTRFIRGRVGSRSLEDA